MSVNQVSKSCGTCNGGGITFASAAAMRGAPMGASSIGKCIVCKGSGIYPPHEKPVLTEYAARILKLNL